MNALTRWDPFRELADVHGRLSSILGRSQGSETSSQGDTVPTPDWVPVVDIAENDKGYLLKIEIPGVREDDVSVTIENRLLTVSGERKPAVAEGVRYLRMERASGTFARAFQLAESVDPETVEARFRNGVLEIHVGKSEVSKPRVIQVKSE
jgi:HSP20 family protein